VVTADQLIAHAVGDYVIQSDWMATEKTKRSLAALIHVVTYALPFLFLTREPLALGFIAGTHFVIDRWRLARYVCWAKNWPWPGRRPWADCTGTGYPSDRPAWLTTWLLIIVDNIMHVILNAVALRWLG
jgi:hypothetical protein